MKNIAKKFKKLFVGKNLKKFGKIKSFFTKRKLILLGVLFLIFLVGRGFFSKGQTWEVETGQVGRGDLTTTISASGKVGAEKKADLTFLTSGRVSWVGVKEGDTVHAWQAVASLDKRQIELQLKKLLGNFERQFTLFDDTSDAYKDSVLTDAVKRIKERAQIDLDQTVIDVEIQNVAIELASIVSPFSGIVVKAEPAFAGINVTPATAIYSIVDPSSLYFEAEVNEVDVSNIKMGQRVILVLDAFPDKEVVGTVTNIGFVNVITSTGGTAYKVKIAISKDKETVLRLGMKGDAGFVLEEIEGVLTVPSTAIVEEEEKTSVWVVEEGKAKRKEVVVGASSLEDSEILEGINEGETIIVLPPAKIKEGDKIKSS
jgi:RND family efflux transporter MFP subunit